VAAVLRVPALLRAVGSRVPVSGLGWTVLALAVGLGLLGHARGWIELTVPAVALAAALVAGALLSVGRSTYEVDLEMSDHRVTVGDRAVGRIVVRNASRRRLLPARIELPVGKGSANFPLPSLGPGESHEEVFAIPTTRRAVVTVGPVRSVRGDPLGMVRRRLQWTGGVDLYVHPKLVSLKGAASGVLKDLEGQATRVISDSDLSFHALRDYVAGDDRRHIHWRSTARMNKLMVRQFEDTRRTHTVLALSTDPDDYADADEFEIAVAALASIGTQALRDQRELTVLAGDGCLRTDAPGRMLDDVAALEAAPGTHDSSSLGRWIAREVPSATVAIVITGSVPSMSELRASAMQIPAAARTLILAVEAGRDGEVATHDRLSLARIGSLLDLPRILRRVAVG
jgi:uncharacterized protein (DUF58 family)